MTDVAFGTAHLFGLVPAADSRALLAAAVAAGFRRFDTAPSYGHGTSEPELARALAEAGLRAGTDCHVTTKAGIAAVPPAPLVRRAVGRAVRLLPQRATTRRRRRQRPAGHGRFAVDDVRTSIETSLDRLGPIDRLMLHEANPADLNDELLALLSQYRDDRCVGQVGVATQNTVTASCVERAPELLTAVHYTAGPLGDPVDLPETVTARIGHGLLGPDASHLRAMATELRRDHALAARWVEATAGTRWAGRDGLGAALMSTTARRCTGVVIATSRPERLAPSRELLQSDDRPEAEIATVLDDIVRRARARRAA